MFRVYSHIPILLSPFLSDYHTCLVTSLNHFQILVVHFSRRISVPFWLPESRLCFLSPRATWFTDFLMASRFILWRSRHHPILISSGRLNILRTLFLKHAVCSLLLIFISSLVAISCVSSLLRIGRCSDPFPEKWTGPNWDRQSTKACLWFSASTFHYLLTLSNVPCLVHPPR